MKDVTAAAEKLAGRTEKLLATVELRLAGMYCASSQAVEESSQGD
jgi:hypothetical protein